MRVSGATCEELPNSNVMGNKSVSPTLKIAFPCKAEGVTKVYLWKELLIPGTTEGQLVSLVLSPVLTELELEEL